MRNGYQAIRASFRSAATRPPRSSRQIVDQSRARSAVFDVLTNGVPVSVEIDAG